MLQSNSIVSCLVTLLFVAFARAHVVITYPGWRGDNLHTTGTVEDTNGLGTAQTDNGTLLHPFGMQWQYPCGAMPMSDNRTLWPVTGGAIAFQPGWFAGHGSAFMYFNLGLGNNPLNYSFVMKNGLNLIGPDKQPYPGTFCLPQVPLPAHLNVSIGDNATIQVIETAIHGAALYSCVDITFADPKDVAEVNASNCFNSTQISSNLIFTTEALSQSDAITLSPRTYGIVSALLAGVLAVLLI